MRTIERLDRLKEWTYENVCKGRMMKTPAPQMDVTKLARQEPKVYIAYYPMRPDQTAWVMQEILNTAPSILLMPITGFFKNNEKQYHDDYKGIHRPQELGQSLSVQVLFSVFEDGVRLPGFIDEAEKGPYDMTLIKEGTYDGVSTLLNWMDDFKEKLLGAKFIPKTDLFLTEATATYDMFTDQKYIADQRPLYVGFVNVTFQCYAKEANNETINNLLK